MAPHKRIDVVLKKDGVSIASMPMSVPTRGVVYIVHEALSMTSPEEPQEIVLEVTHDVEDMDIRILLQNRGKKEILKILIGALKDRKNSRKGGKYDADVCRKEFRDALQTLSGSLISSLPSKHIKGVFFVDFAEPFTEFGELRLFYSADGEELFHRNVRSNHTASLKIVKNSQDKDSKTLAKIDILNIDADLFSRIGTEDMEAAFTTLERLKLYHKENIVEKNLYALECDVTIIDEEGIREISSIHPNIISMSLTTVDTTLSVFLTLSSISAGRKTLKFIFVDVEKSQVIRRETESIMKCLRPPPESVVATDNDTDNNTDGTTEVTAVDPFDYGIIEIIDFGNFGDDNPWGLSEVEEEFEELPLPSPPSKYS